MKRKPTAKQLEAERIALAAAFTSARKESGMSLREMASATELGLQTLVRLEAGSTGIGLANLQIALAAVGLKIDVVRRD